jgi:hypothetical protein
MGIDLTVILPTMAALNTSVRRLPRGASRRVTGRSRIRARSVADQYSRSCRLIAITSPSPWMNTDIPRRRTHYYSRAAQFDRESLSQASENLVDRKASGDSMDAFATSR